MYGCTAGAMAMVAPLQVAQHGFGLVLLVAELSRYRRTRPGAVMVFFQITSAADTGRQ